MSYDPEVRRDTPLALKLKARIRRDGPITVRQYMQACLHDPEHGYYLTRAAIGRQGDFITAPEISQIFGELIGLWCAVVWQQMCSPPQCNLIELGPGRGTLMRDALRAARVMPRFLAALRVTLIERNPALMAEQRAALGGAIDTGLPVAWNGDILALLAAKGSAAGDACRTHPAIIIGNEFLDCMPQEQYVRVGAGWLLRRVGLDCNGRLEFCVGPSQTAASGLMPRRDAGLDRLYPATLPDDIVEPGQHGWIDEQIIGWPKVAALLLDYGTTTPASGDTLQAVRNHAYEHSLTSPGEADLTLHVDFAAIARGATKHGSLQLDGPTTQSEFLGALGITERASRLMAANPAKAGGIEAAVARLMSPTGMGGRFQAVGLRSVTLPPLPGFPTLDSRSLA